MQWSEELSVGIAEIDAQHKTLAECIARVEDAVTTQQRWLTVHSAVVRLTDFARIHFAVEESLMRIHRYPELERHADEHRQFAERLRQLQEVSLRADVSDQVIERVRQWQHEHVLSSDRHYAAYLHANIVPGRRSVRRASKSRRGREPKI